MPYAGWQLELVFFVTIFSIFFLLFMSKSSGEIFKVVNKSILIYIKRICCTNLELVTDRNSCIISPSFFDYEKV